MNFNVKKIALIATLVMIISFSFAAAIFYNDFMNISNGKGNWFGLGSYNIVVDQEETVGLNNINSLQIETTSHDINIIPTAAGEALRVHLRGEISSSNEVTPPELRVVKTGDSVTVTVRNNNSVTRGIMVNYSSSLQLDVYLPEDYNKSLAINTSSGRTKIQDLKLQSFNYNATSGDLSANSIIADSGAIISSSGRVTIKELIIEDLLKQSSSSGDATIDSIAAGNASFNSSSGKLKIKDAKVTKALSATTTSGDIVIGTSSSDTIEIQGSSARITIDEITTKSLQHQSSSGDLTIKKGNIEYGSLKAASGRISVNNTKGDLSITTTSGDISVDYTQFNNNLTIASSSGRVMLSLQRDAAFTLQVETSSGKINSSFPVTTTGILSKNSLRGTVAAGTGNIVISTSSGDVNINN